MRSFAPALISLIGSAAVSIAAPSSTTSSPVITLTEKTFTNFMEEHPLVLANFYAPWCSYSRMLAPEFEAAAKELSEVDIPLVKVDCTQESALCAEYGVRAYPTLGIFRGAEAPKRWVWSRGSESIVFHMVQELVDDLHATEGDGSELRVQDYE